MRIPYMTLLFACYAGYCLWTGFWPKKPMKWYDRFIRITGGVFLSGWVVLMILVARHKIVAHILALKTPLTSPIYAELIC